MKHNFRELKIWKDSIELVKSIYAISELLPKEELYGLKSQLNRCAISIPSNIAEGSGRTTIKEFIHFLNISLSSSYELETQLILINTLFKIEVNSLLAATNELQRMIIGFKKTINKTT